MKIFGHRGACGYEPENTLSSFQKAIEIGVDAIELDVYVLRSGELVVIHDDKVERTTNGSGYVLDHTFEALRRLDAGNGQFIPTLQEVLDLVNMNTAINIELKGVGTAKAVAATVSNFLEIGWSEESFMVSSFNRTELVAFSKLMPNIRTGILIVGIPIDFATLTSSIGAYSINPSYEFITKEFVEDAKSRNLKIFAFTVDSESEVQRMQSLGVDGIFTNYPDKSKTYLIR